MIVTVTLHTSIDRALQVDDVERPAAPRLLGERVAGKGVNLSRVLAALGRPSLALGVVGRDQRARFATTLASAGVDSAWVEVAGPTRCNLTYLDPTHRRERHARRSGFTVDAAAVEALRGLLEVRVRADDVVVFAGSLPAGLGGAQAMDLARTFLRRGATLVLDSGGEVLRQGLGLAPALIAPNQQELGELTGQRPASVTGLLALVRGLVPPCRQVIVTMGARGALLVGAAAAWHARVDVESAVSSVGCGDALLAGFLDARLRGDDDAACLAAGVACGASAALQPLAGDVEPGDVRRLRPRVRVQALTTGASG